MSTGGSTTSGERRPCVVLLTAMQQELKPLVKQAGLQRVGFEDGSIHAGAIDEVKVIATHTSMGTQAATDTTERILASTVVDHLVVVGIAGGLNRELPLGHVLVPEVVVDRQTGSEHRATALADVPLSGRLSTSDVLENTDEDLAALRAGDIDVLDMETASIAIVCERHGVPWTAFRAISDQVGDAAIDDELFAMSNDDGSPDLAAVARYVARHPGRVPDMARLGRQMDRATNAAAAAAIDACRRHDFVVR